MNVGDQVFWKSYSDSITSGKIVAIKNRPQNRDPVYCIEQSDGFVLVERGLFATKQEAALHLAAELQNDAAAKLRVAASDGRKIMLAPFQQQHCRVDHQGRDGPNPVLSGWQVRVP